MRVVSKILKGFRYNSHSKLGYYTMRSFIKTKIFLGILIVTVLSTACDDKEDGINYRDGLASLIEEVSGPVVVTENTSFILKSEGISPNDRLFLRSAENPHIEIAVDWGYSYLGKDENGDYAYDRFQVIVEVEFNDQWQVGEWQVVLQRGNDREVISTVDINVLNLKKEPGIESAHVNLDDVYKGIIHVYADGWQGKGIDYYEFVNNQTNAKLIYDSNVNLDVIEPYHDELISFNRDSLSTGLYSLFIRRWEYGFRQKICDFDYFKIGFVNEDPITKGSNGEYSFDLYIDKIVNGDVLSVGYGNKGFKETLKEESFNAETQVYRVVVPSAHVKDVTFNVTLTRNRANLSIGSKELIVSE